MNRSRWKYSSQKSGSERMIRIMELRYLEERSWEEIAEEMWISESRMFKLHKAAVAALGSNEE